MWDLVVSAAASAAAGAAGGVIAAAIGVAYHRRRDRERDRTATVEAVREAMDGRLEAIVSEQKAINRELHGRISGLRDDHGETREQLGRIEGQLSAVNNTLHIIQNKYMGPKGG